MTHEEGQEGFSQIRKLIYRTQGQLYGVQRRRSPIWQIANCVCTAREQLQEAEQELNELDRTAEIGDAAKELSLMNVQQTVEMLETVNAELIKARQELRFLRVYVSVKRSRVASSHQIVDEGDAAMQQCNVDFRLALTELETARKQLLKEKSWLKRLRRRTEEVDDPHQ